MRVWKSLASLVALGIFFISWYDTSFASLNAPQLLSPLDGCTISFPLMFRWTSVNGAHFYTLEYSKNTSFQDATSLDLFDTMYAITSTLEDGHWYWHVRANTSQGESGPWSATWSFEVGLPVPWLQSPVNGATQGTSEVYFDWTDVTGGQKGGELYDFDHFVLQYSTSNTFASQNTFTISRAGGLPLRDSCYGPVSLVDGTYYWRVKAVYIRYPDGSLTEGIWSTSFTFFISTGGANIHSVELIQPLNTTLKTNNPTFIWRIPLKDYWNVTTWTLELASDPQMLWNRKMIIIGLADLYTTVLENKATISYTLTSSQSLPNGTWYWHVSAIDKTGNTSFFSSVESFVVDVGVESPVKATLISPPNGFINTPKRPTFSWGQVTGATSYNLQVAFNSNFVSTVIDKDNITTTSYMTHFDLEPGTYYWRVIPDIPNAEWSDVWYFIIAGGPPPQVELISPENGAPDMSLCPFFQWKALEGAKTYTLEVSTGNLFTNLVVVKTGLITPSWGTLSDWESHDPPQLESGTYYWRVSSDLASSTSTIWTFTVSEEEKDEKIRITVVLSNMDGDPVSGATITFNSGRMIMGIAISSELGKAVVSGLEAGTYILEVTASGYHSYREPISISESKTENIILYRRGIIHGYVYYHDIQNPAPDVEVIVYDSETQLRIASDITDTKGYFIVDNIADKKTYYIVVENYEDQKKTDIAPVYPPNSDNSLTIIIKMEGKVVGVIQDENGNLLHDAKVTLKDIRGQSINTALTDKIGSFVFNISSGNYYIEVILTGYEKYRSEMFNVKSEEIKDLELITLRREIGTLQVSLNDENGKPIEGFVTINDVNGESIKTLPTVNSTISINLTTSDYFIIIDAPGFLSRILPLTIQKENEPIIIELKTELGSISITVLDTDGDPISKAKVFVDNKEVGNTDEEGNLSVGDIMPGEHEVAVRKSKYFPFEQRINVARGGVLPIIVTLEAESFILKIWYFICQFKLPITVIYTFSQICYTIKEYFEAKKIGRKFSLWKTILPIFGIFFIFVDLLHLRK